MSNHLSYEQLEEYLDQTVGPLERQKILVHTRGCAMCAAELEDLEQFRARMRAPAIGRWRALTTLWGRPALVAAAAAIILAVAVSGWWVLALCGFVR